MVVSVHQRDSVLALLEAQGIGVAVHYPTPIHLQPSWGEFGRAGQFPHSEALARSVLSLPLFPGMTDQQIERCVSALSSALGQAA